MGPPAQSLSIHLLPYLPPLPLQHHSQPPLPHPHPPPPHPPPPLLSPKDSALPTSPLEFYTHHLALSQMRQVTYLGAEMGMPDDRSMTRHRHTSGDSFSV